MRQSILALAFAGCTMLGSPPVAAEDNMANSTDITKAADWNEMKTVNVELSEHDFDPKHLKLKANKAYRMAIQNNGEADHYYTAADFFKSIAWRKAQTPRPHGCEIKAPYFTAVEACKKGGTAELFFVPVKEGSV